MPNAKKVDTVETPTNKNYRRGKHAQSGTIHTKTSRLGFRASEPQARIIRLASDISHKSLTDFIMDSAYQAAEKVILDQRLFIVSEDIFNEFSAILDRPAKENEGLKELFSSSSPWDLHDVKKT